MLDCAARITSRALDPTLDGGGDAAIPGGGGLGRVVGVGELRRS